MNTHGYIVGQVEKRNNNKKIITEANSPHIVPFPTLYFPPHPPTHFFLPDYLLLFCSLLSSIYNRI